MRNVFGVHNASCNAIWHATTMHEVVDFALRACQLLVHLTLICAALVVSRTKRSPVRTIAICLGLAGVLWALGVAYQFTSAPEFRPLRTPLTALDLFLIGVTKLSQPLRLAVILAFLCSAPVRRFVRASAEAACLRCWYPLIGSCSDRCSECGTLRAV